MTIDAGDVVKVTARLQWAGSVSIQNVFYAESLAATQITDEDCMDDLAAWMEVIYDSIAPYMVDTLDFVDILFHEMVADRPIGQLTWPSLTSGGAAVDPLASGVAAVITAYTTINRSRGRKFFGLFGEGDITAGLFAGGILSDLAFAAAGWVTNFAGATSGQSWLPGIWRVNKTPHFIDFTEWVVRAVPGYQRRRKENVGI